MIDIHSTTWRGVLRYLVFMYIIVYRCIFAFPFIRTDLIDLNLGWLALGNNYQMSTYTVNHLYIRLLENNIQFRIFQVAISISHKPPVNGSNPPWKVNKFCIFRPIQGDNMKTSLSRLSTKTYKNIVVHTILCSLWKSLEFGGAFR